jgi:CRISPR/Cas system CMR subunit Cmr4 (Cas7 group RAMP superfamily)
VSPTGVGERWLRLEVVTPTNVGSAAGGVTLDRPTQKESWHGLPYLPDSALKGVLAAPFGDVARPGGNPRREALFGAPDRGNARGRAGPLVIGNGELLAFPVPCSDGRAAWVFPAGSAARALSEAIAGGGAPANVLDLLSRLEEGGDEGDAAAWPGLPELALPVALRALVGGPIEKALAESIPHLIHLAGKGVPAGGPLLVVGSATAGALWRFAAERRALTALDGARRTVVRGSLRAVELIPPGTVFLSLVSLLDPASELPPVSRLALGAWESLGLGWVRPAMVEPLSAPSRTAARPREGQEIDARRREPPATGDSGSGPTVEAEVMVAMHQAVGALRERGDRRLQSVARSAVAAFGPRAHFSGLEAALAFELAKAKLAQGRPKIEARAHRWLLAGLLTGEPDPDQAPGPCRALLAWLEGGLGFSAERIGEQRGMILARWRWLRRYAELGLAELEGGAEP